MTTRMPDAFQSRFQALMRAGLLISQARNQALREHGLPVRRPPESERQYRERLAGYAEMKRRNQRQYYARKKAAVLARRRTP